MGKMQSKLKLRGLEDLHQCTAFTDEEVAEWYRSFMKEFPSGRISLERFKEVYHRQFPEGDPSEFAQHVFRTFDTNKDKTIDFREFMCGLNATSRGTPEQRLRWAFTLYDLDGDGFIQKQEMIEMLTAVRKMFASPMYSPPKDESMTPEKQTEILFRKMDKNKDGKLSLEEFLDGARSHPSVLYILLDSPTKPFQ
ncbi:neurocalcin homolog [Ixodes scapularis]|uniref:neurocalcin homolog n=1 Tax=Ixodes scapularis TaxID=6945 RepID=UPI001A9F3F06|nr:neurocalcin homolog [Ixodes scapularis]